MGGVAGSNDRRMDGWGRMEGRNRYGGERGR